MKNKKDREFLYVFDNDEDYYNKFNIWLVSHNIIYEKLELFKDFLISLNDLIENTFLGSDVYNDADEIKTHFDWCWNKTIENFTKEKIFFKQKGVHHEYFWLFFYEAFYISLEFGETPKTLGYLIKLFNIKNIKTKSEMDLLYDVYKILNIHLK